MSRSLRLVLPWFTIALVALAAAALRFGAIEPPAVAHQCTADGGPAWCAWRHWAVLGFLSYGYGYAALTAAFIALVARHPLAAWLAAALGIAALVLYCFEAGAFALLVGALRLLRAQADGLPPGDQHRQPEGQVQAQP
ncbi:hypothetical protein [Frateuria sp. STR12]|uniref:hypothetical protein n=1 Tax=Frateuria hangzhouensis TaxID=2995589 RepID=UPI002260BFA8|nr:hypothetical protein [Frateuria sp. STR12]MCX7514549.1 hypothetical protein [Frateuria sp. STR12]